MNKASVTSVTQGSAPLDPELKQAVTDANKAFREVMYRLMPEAMDAGYPNVRESIQTFSIADPPPPVEPLLARLKRRSMNGGDMLFLEAIERIEELERALQVAIWKPPEPEYPPYRSWSDASIKVASPLPPPMTWARLKWLWRHERVLMVGFLMSGLAVLYSAAIILKEKL